jgi:hypothetical protein
LEAAVANLLTHGSPGDQQVARLVRADLAAFHKPPASVESDDEFESESESELNTAFCSSPAIHPPRCINLASPIYETPARPMPPLPLCVVPEGDESNPLDESIEWAEDAFDDQMCRIAARYDTYCSCCNYPVKIEIFQ